MKRTLILASTSTYRAQLLAEHGLSFMAVEPNVDERSFDDRFANLEAGEFALELGVAKARSVIDRCPSSLVLAADQIAVVAVNGVDTLLHKVPDAASATAQLMKLSGSTHQLINGVVLLDTDTEEEYTEIDRHEITMRAFTALEAEAYVERFDPFDCVGSYRIEDDADLIASVRGEDRSGIIGLPMPAVKRLLQRAGAS